MKKLIRIYKVIKQILKQIKPINRGELSYEDFEKLESKKYPFNPPRCEEIFMRHHTYQCTSECFRKPR